MQRLFRTLAPLCLAAALPVAPMRAQAPATNTSPHPVLVPVTLSPAAGAALHGRLLLFAKQGHGDPSVETSEFKPEDTWIAAEPLDNLAPGETLTVDADAIAFPKAWSSMPAGDWEIQAVLDVDGTYNYQGRTPGDWVSSVVEVSGFHPGQTAVPALVLDHHPQADPRRQQMEAADLALVKPGEIEEATLQSTVLTQFWSRPKQLRAWVVLPPGYAADPRQRYPTVYWTAGFGGGVTYGLHMGGMLRKRMVDGRMPPMIWVMLDESLPEGTHEFADSVNDGPWGTALTTEFLPMLQAKYRMMPGRNARFLNGHSSGGWATLQLEVNYPQIFGGTWSTSPDPSDFHDFTGVNLYAPHANMYRHADGSPVPIMRDKGKVVATMESFAKMEAVLGPYGGQLASFDWVFSPRSDSGAPEPMFNRTTGDVDPAVVAYWSLHYDLANIVERTRPQRGVLLTGRIHLYVGTADTFYLDGAAHLFGQRLEALGARPDFHFLPGRTHFDLYTIGGDRMGLFDTIAAQMYAVACPGTHWKPAGAGTGGV